MTLDPLSVLARTVTPDQMNEECARILRSYNVGNGGYVAVVGAGPSLPLISLDDEFVCEMRSACGLDPNINYKYFWDFYEDAKEKNKVAYSELLKKKFSSSPYWSNEIYEVICKINFKTIITTNYDQYLPKAFGKVEGNGWNNRFCVYPPRRYYKINGAGMVSAIDFDIERYLVAIHGYIDPENDEWPLDSIILAKSDYLLHYFGNTGHLPLCGWWKEVLTRHNCIFIGSSLKEPGIGQALTDLVKSGAFERQPRQHLQLINASLSAKEIDGIIQTPAYPEPQILYGCVQQVQFDPNNLFEGLLDVLSEIAGIPVSKDLEPRMAAQNFPDFDSLNFAHD